MIFSLAGNHRALTAELTCIAALIAFFMIPAFITTAANLRPKEFWTKPVPIFVIFSGLNKHRELPAQPTQESETSWKIYLKKVHKNNFINYLHRAC
jgi:hypothetical protein